MARPCNNLGRHPSQPVMLMSRIKPSTVAMAWFIACAPAMAVSPGPLPPDADKDLARDILRELVDINTTHDHGSTAAAKVIQQQLLAAGFSANDVVLIAPADKPTKGNVVVRYRAKAHG